jgi:hypothetical protein
MLTSYLFITIILIFIGIFIPNVSFLDVVVLAIGWPFLLLGTLSLLVVGALVEIGDFLERLFT